MDGDQTGGALSAEERDWIARLSSSYDEEEPSGWVRVTPEIVAVFSLRDCEEQLARSAVEPIRLAQAAKSAHLAVQAALTAALAGSMNIGAYPEKLRLQWLQYLQGSSGKRPDKNWVMMFPDLLAQALGSPLEWSGMPLSITTNQQAMLDRLTNLRHGIEHTKPMHWSIEAAYIKEALPIAAHLTAELLEIMFHHLEPGELESVKATANNIDTLCQDQETAD